MKRRTQPEILNAVAECVHHATGNPKMVRATVDDMQIARSLMKQLRERALCVAPLAVANIEVRVLPMKLSSGDVDYYVEIKNGTRAITPYMFRNEEYKAQYEAASLRHVLLGHVKPDLLEYGPEGWPNA